MHVSTSAEGLLVAEVDLRSEADVEGTIELARSSGAAVLWAYGRDLERHGFRPEGGYARLAARAVWTGHRRLPEERDGAELASLYVRAYHGVWGHKTPSADAMEALATRPEIIHVVHPEAGVCRVDLDERLVDAPGVVTAARTPTAYLELLAAACARLGPGPATMDSWGDPLERLVSYRSLGFVIVERIDGYTLQL
jgi:hypothetical protein